MKKSWCVLWSKKYGNCHVSISGRPTRYSCITICMFQPTKPSRSFTEINSNCLFPSIHCLLLFHSFIIFVSLWFIIFLITFLLHIAIIFSFLSVKSHISAPYITTGLKLNHNILNFFVDAFRDSVTGRRAK